MNYLINIRINEKINTPQVRVIDEKGENLGVLATSEAIRIAYDRGLDLVEVSSGATPPVCKIQDYKKFLYEQNAKQRKTKVKKSELKEFVFGPHIDDGDLKVRIDRGRKFLEEGNLVKYSVKFMGRQAMYPGIGETKLKIVESELSESARIENPIKLSGNIMTVTFVAKKSK